MTVPATRGTRWPKPAGASPGRGPSLRAEAKGCALRLHLAKVRCRPDLTGDMRGQLTNITQKTPGVIVAVLATMLSVGAAEAAQCGSTGAGFDAWKREFAAEAK